MSGKDTSSHKNAEGISATPSEHSFRSRIDAALGSWSENGRQISKPLTVTFVTFLTLTVIALTGVNIVNEYRNLKTPLDKLVGTASMHLAHQKAIATANLEKTLITLTSDQELANALRGKGYDGFGATVVETTREFRNVVDLSIYNNNQVALYSSRHPEQVGRKSASDLGLLAKRNSVEAPSLTLTESGLLAMTVVSPWIVDNRPIGHIRLTVSVNNIITDIGTAMNVDMVKIVNLADNEPNTATKAPVPPGWRHSDTIAYKAIGAAPIPEAFATLLQTGLASNDLLGRSFMSDGRVKVAYSIPLDLVNGDQSASVVLLRDATDAFHAFARSVGVSLAIGACLAALSWLVFKRMLASLQFSVVSTRQKLEREVEANTNALEYSKNRLLEAQRIASVGSWERDLITGDLFWSEEMFRIIGIPLGTDAIAARQVLYRLIPPNERPLVETALETAVRDCSTFNFEHQIIRSDGGVRFMHVRGYVTANSDGQAARVFGTVHDITERHTAQEQSQLMADILEASLNEVYIIDWHTFYFQHANKCARDNLGFSIAEMSAMTPWDVSPQHTETSFRQMLSPLLNGDVPLLNVEGIQLRKDGSTYPVEVRLQMYHEGNRDLLVAIANDLTERTTREKETRAAKEEAERMAYFDTLTKLPNRAGCQRDANRLFAASNGQKPAFIIHMDLDNFKRTNDTLGHSAGDHCLAEAGERLRTCCTGLGQAYRWGGDEFVIIASGPDSDPEELCERANVVMRAPMEFEGNQIWPSVSMGVARCPDDGQDFGTLLVHADLALYRSKDNGKDRWCFFTSDMKIDSDEEARTEKELRAAIRNDEFFLVFQPQVNIRTQKVTGIEALVRWQHPTRGTLGPGAFLPVVEKSNLASMLGTIVIDKALAAARAWQDIDLDFGRIAVNLSPSHLISGTLLNDFNAAMERHNVGPEKITAEVLESVFLDDERSDNSQTLEELHNLGVHIELDDFGTGYASLSHVADLPINGLKIDRSFTAQILDDHKKEIVVNQLIHLARSLDIGIICEGVETDAQYDRLRMMGDFSVQGYLIARPMPYEAITEWLSASPEDLLFVI